MRKGTKAFCGVGVGRKVTGARERGGRGLPSSIYRLPDVMAVGFFCEVPAVFL